MKPTDCCHECACGDLWTHVPNCDDGGDDSWLCPRCETKRAKRIRQDELSAAMAKFRAGAA